MPKYDVTFTETVVYTIRVDANDEDEAYEKATKLLQENTSKLHAVAQALIEKEKLDAKEFEEIFVNN